ncbi:MAG: ArnT family glycosyltransferase [Myxococcaceae bacterium]
MIPAAKLPSYSPREAIAPQAIALPEAWRRWSVRAAVLIAGASLVRLLFIATTEIANGEAYYYVWSRFPALSYYDHPPLIAWLTWLTTQYSHSSFAIRFGPVVYSALFGVLVYRLGERLFSPRAGFIAVAIVTAMPVFLVSNFVLNPESPLAPLWVLGLLLIDGMRTHDESWRPLAAGLVVGLAFLAKYSGVVLAAVALLYFIASPQARRWLRRPSLYLGGLIALVVASPVVLWNYQRQWPSLVLHFVERTGPTDLTTWSVNAFHAFLGQFGPFHPLMFPGLLVVLAIAIRRSGKDDRYRFLALASWPVLLFFLVMMVRVRDPEHHWTMVGYIPLALAAGGLLDEVLDNPPMALRVYLTACIAVSLAIIVGLYAYSQDRAFRRFVPASAYDADHDFFNEMAGWTELKAAVDASAAGLGPNTVVASCQYALCAHILTALDDRPTVYCPSVRHTEFDFIGRRDPPKDVPVLYITDDHYHDDPAQLLPERNCQPQRVVSIERNGVLLQNYRLWACLPQGG